MHFLSSLSLFGKSKGQTAAWVGLLCVTSLIMSGCGGDKPKPPAPAGGGTATTPAKPVSKPATPAKPAATKATKPPKTLGAGSIKGKVVLKGTPYKNAPIDMSAKSDCKEHYEDEGIEDVFEDVVIVGEGGALKNAIVYISDGTPKGDFGVLQETVVLNQKGCMYSPHVFALQALQPVMIRNSDGFLHNIHSYPQDELNDSFNFGQKAGDDKTAEPFEEEELIQFKCDVHAWMSSYGRVFSHPYFSVTGADGGFEIKNLPAGKYKLSVWHEYYGKTDDDELTQDVEVGDDEAKSGVEFTFEAK